MLKVEIETAPPKLKEKVGYYVHICRLLRICMCMCEMYLHLFKRIPFNIKYLVIVV